MHYYKSGGIFWNSFALQSSNNYFDHKNKQYKFLLFFLEPKSNGKPDKVVKIY